VTEIHVAEEMRVRIHKLQGDALILVIHEKAGVWRGQVIGNCFN